MFADRVLRTLESEARRCLASALAPLPGPKTLLVDDTLFDTRMSVARPLDLFTDANFMREHGIRSVAPLSAHTSQTIIDMLAHPSVVIVIRGPNAAAARHAVTAIRLIRRRAAAQAPNAGTEQANSDESKTNAEGALSSSPLDEAPKCLVLTTPRRSHLIEKVMRLAGLNTVPVMPLPLGFLPFDADLVTLDWPGAYRQIRLDGDNSAILATSSALLSLASSLEVEFATVRTAGAAAGAVAEELLQTHGQTYAPRSASTVSSTVSSPSQTRPSTPLFSPSDAFTLSDVSPGPNSSFTLADATAPPPPRRPVTLVIIDRGVDVVSPMLTQWTYEGLLDEAVGLHNNVMDLPMSSLISEDAINILTEAPGTSTTLRKRLRGDEDRIFAQLRDLNYWTAARQIGSIANSVRAYYERRPTRENAEIAQMKDYVKGLREVKTEHASATAHTAIAAEISARTFDSFDFKRRFEIEREMIEGGAGIDRRVYVTDAIARGDSLSHIIRLCCLWSVTSGGMDADELDTVKREIMANFGLGVLPLLANLERAGMLVRSNREGAPPNLSWIPIPRIKGGGRTGGSASFVGSGTASTTSSEDGKNRGRGAEYSWQFARAALRLVTEFDPEREVLPGTVAAVSAPYSGYRPLSVRLVEAALTDNGWSTLPPVGSRNMLLPPGHAMLEHRRSQQKRAFSNSKPSSTAEDSTHEDGFDAVVLMIGGIVRAEASAIRLAAKAAGIRTIIATTAVMGSDEFVLSLSDRTIWKTH